MKPPAEPIMVHCIHCDQEYDSDQIMWVPHADDSTDKHALPGMWCCPMEGCDGAGFCFDIFPVDKDYVDPESGEKIWHDDPPMIEGHASDCDCVECEMAWEAQEAEFEREAEEYKRKVASGEITPPPPRSGTLGEDDIPF